MSLSFNQLRSSIVLVKLTIFFFVVSLYSNSVLAQQFTNPVTISTQQTTLLSIAQGDESLPVTYVSEEESQQLVWLLQKQGYIVKEGSFKQLAELEKNLAEQAPKKPKEIECIPKKDAKSKLDNKNTSAVNSKTNLPECGQEQSPSSTETVINQPVVQPPLEPIPPASAPPPQQTTVHTSVGLHADLSYGSGGGRSDMGKVFFIVAGVMVIAAFIVYAGKYVTDLVKGKDVKTWWEFVFSSTFLDTNSGQTGKLNGIKIATGFVSSDLIQVALVGEFGNADLDLLLNEYSSPVPLDISASYWMVGATARLHLSDKLVNASYLYLDFMGGSTNDSATDTIGSARLGASFGINDYIRLGASLGAQYIGLDGDQGFVNDGDNYWTTFGIEMGVKF